MVYKLIDKYYKNYPALREILITHSQSVKDLALNVAKQHPQWHVDLKIIEEGAMLHDIGIFLCNAPKILCTGTHLYIEHGYLGGRILRDENLPLYANIAERHTGSGLTENQIREQNLPLPHQNFLPLSLEEKIICYADKFFSKTHLNEKNSIEKIQKTMDTFGYGARERWNKIASLMES